MSKKAKAIFKYTLLALGSLCLCIFGFLYYLLATTSGLNSLINFANSKFSDVLTITSDIQEGSVLKGFKTDKYFEVLVKDIVSVRADKLNIKYGVLSYLTKNVFEVSLIDATNLKVELLPDPPGYVETADTDDDSDYENFRLDFLVHILVDKVKLDKFAYLSDIVDVMVDKADLSLEAYDAYAAVTKGTIDSPLVHLKYEDDGIDDDEKLPEILTFDNGNGAIEKIYDIDLPLDPALHNLTLNHARYYMDVYDTGYFDAKLDASWVHTLLKVDYVDIKHDLGSFKVDGTLDFIDYYNMDFNIEGFGHKTEYTLNHYEGGLYDLKGKGHLKGDLVNLSLDADLSSPYQVKVFSRINSLSEQVPFIFKVQSPLISYPLVAKQTLDDKAQNESVKNFLDALKNVEKSLDPKVEAKVTKDKRLNFKDLDFAMDGQIFKTLKVDLKTTFEGHGFKDIKTKIDGNLSLDNAHINEASFNGLLGDRKFKANVLGDFDFTQDFEYKGNVEIKADDAKGLWEPLQGEFDAKSNLAIAYDDELSLNIDSLDANFYLNGAKAKLDVKNAFGSANNGFSIEHAKFTQADNEIVLKGEVEAEGSDFTGSVKLKDLSKLDKQLTGSFLGRLQITGALDSPVIKLTGKSEVITYDNLRFSKLVLDTNVDTLNQDGNLSMVVHTIRFDKDINPYRNCSLDIAGNFKDHRLNFACGQGSGSFLSATGGYNQETSQYKGEISSLMVVSHIIEPVSLLEPVNVNYSLKQHQGTISPIKLSNGIASIKIADTKFSPQRIDTKAILDEVELVSFNRYFPKNLDLRGRMSMQADISVNRGILTLKANAKANHGGAVISNAFLPYEHFDLDLDINERALSAIVNAKLTKDHGKLSFNAHVSDPYKSKTLDGQIKLEDLDLSLFTATTNAINSLKGKLNIKGKLQGSLDKPLFYGSISAQGNAAPSYNLGLFNDFKIDVNASGSRGDLKGMILVNGSEANLKGYLDWSDGAKGILNFDADNLPIFLLSYGEAMANIHTKVSLDDHLKVTGNIEIPKALIKFKDIETQAVAPSMDEIFVDDNSNLTKTVNKLRVKSLNNDMELDVNVALGKNIKVDAMGLKADAFGNVHITKKSDRTTIIGDGKLFLDNGHAELYGHKFIVNKAEAIFKGNVFNPYVDAEVVVDQSTIDDDVVAGVQVKGRTQDLDIKLFSKPAMSQNEILSYLLYGHGLEKTDTVSTNTDNASTQLLMSLGLGTTTGLINSVVGIFGMDGVQFGSSGTGNDTQVEVQTYITNRIRLSYGYGVFNSLNEFKIRYEIMRKLYLEFISSMDQSVDLIYSFESK